MTVVDGLVLLQEGPRLLASRGLQLLRSEDDGRTWRPVCSLPVPLTRRAWMKGRLAARMFRSGVHRAEALSGDRTVVLADRYLYVLDCDDTVVSRAPIEGSRPLNVCVDPNDRILYGEYRNNPERSPVAIWASEDAGHTWTDVLRLDGVRHFHGVYYDPFSGDYWFTTGDRDEECAIWRSDSSFQNRERIVSGSQGARVIALIFTRDCILFGTDMPDEQNYVCRLERSSWRTTRLAPVAGPVYYGVSNVGGFFFSTVCEPGKGGRISTAVVYHSADGEAWTPILTERKDRWPMHLFQYGQLRLPRGKGAEDGIWVGRFATTGDRTSVRISIADNS